MKFYMASVNKKKAVIFVVSSISAIAISFAAAWFCFASDFVRTSEITTDAIEKSVRININEADAAQLCFLPGIGEKKAEKILSYRQQVGRIDSLEQLCEISGISEEMVHEWVDYTYIE